jgi:hypothetical protein
MSKGSNSTLAIDQLYEDSTKHLLEQINLFNSDKGVNSQIRPTSEDLDNLDDLLSSLLGNQAGNLINEKYSTAESFIHKYS